MGTPASVISSPAVPWQAPEPRARKKAAANIFKDIDLLQIQTLFRTSGDECAEERARIIYNCAGDRRIAEALVKLRRKKRNKSFHSSPPKLSSDRIGGLTMQNFNKLCITETAHKGTTSPETSPALSSSTTPDTPSLSATKKVPGKQRTKSTLRRQQQSPVSAYLHQIKR